MKVKNIIPFRLKRDPLRILVPFSTVAGFTSYVLLNSVAPSLFYFGQIFNAY
jgi:hypothetical protein